MQAEDSAAAAISRAQSQARAVIAERDEMLRRRAAALAEAPPSEPRRFQAQTPAMRELLAQRSHGVLIAEGDSWFDYPLYDIVNALEEGGWDVESIAHRGDRIEQMAYEKKQIAEFVRRLDKILGRGTVPRAILLSGGGNDVAGTEFEMLLNHAMSANSGLNRTVLEGVVGERLRDAYIWEITRITDVCKQRLGRALPIVVHGYDHPVPDGRGYLGGWWILPGPWLEPGFRKKGFEDLDERRRLAGKLIDRFNEMLIEVASMSDFQHVRYINLRGTLSWKEDYKKDWADELHPNESGFKKIAEKFVAVIKELPK